MTRALLAGILFLGFSAPDAHATLATGSIGFVGFNSDGTDNLAFVALAPIPSGEVIFFSDEEWNGTAWASDTESQFSWTASSSIAAGTIVTLNNVLNIYSGSPAPSSNFGTILGITDANNLANIANADDAVFAYQGGNAFTPSTFLAMIANEDSVGGGWTLTGTGLSQAAGTAIVFTTDEDAMAYIGPRSGEATFSAYLPELANLGANWTTVGSSPDGTTLLPFSTTAFTITSVPEVSAFAFSGLICCTMGLWSLRRRLRKDAVI
jgi:uncharacterized protein